MYGFRGRRIERRYLWFEQIQDGGRRHVGKISNGHISATGRPIHFMFCSRVGADPMALFSIRTNSRWRPPASWIMSNGYISATAHDLLISRIARSSLRQRSFPVNSNYGRISYRFRDIDAFSSKIACFSTPPLLDALQRRNALQYQRSLYTAEKYIQWATILSLTIRVYLHSFSCWSVRNLRNPAKFSANSN